MRRHPLGDHTTRPCCWYPTARARPSGAHSTCRGQRGQGQGQPCGSRSAAGGQSGSCPKRESTAARTGTLHPTALAAAERGWPLPFPPLCPVCGGEGGYITLWGPLLQLQSTIPGRMLDARLLPVLGAPCATQPASRPAVNHGRGPAGPPGSAPPSTLHPHRTLAMPPVCWRLCPHWSRHSTLMGVSTSVIASSTGAEAPMGPRWSLQRGRRTESARKHTRGRG